MGLFLTCGRGVSELKNTVFFERLQWKPPHLELRMNDSQAQSEQENGSENLQIPNLDLRSRDL
jgi:hypothetical protein